MITTALIRPAFVADTLRHSVIECTYKAYVRPMVAKYPLTNRKHSK